MDDTPRGRLLAIVRPLRDLAQRALRVGRQFHSILQAAVEGRHREELALLPRFRGVVVALRALESRAGEQTQRVGHRVVRHVHVAQQVARGAVAFRVRGARGGDHRRDELVVGQAGPHRLADPVRERFAAELAQARLHAQEVKPEVGGVARVAGGVEQRVDEARAFVVVRVCRECLRLFYGRNAARDRQVAPAHEFGVARKRGRRVAELGE